LENNRRVNDFRLDNIDLKIKELKTENKEILDDIIYIKTRIDNGFSTSIESTENKVDYIDNENKTAHKELKDDIKDLSKKFDKLLWFIVGIPSTYILSEIVRYFI